ncbi:Hint domain-containing protein [Rhodophyticola porphyridii]|nr:Hint domain-containing protein [Rhodophyticola porphyridii]
MATIRPTGNNTNEFIVTTDSGRTFIIARDNLWGYDLTDGNNDGFFDVNALDNISSSSGDMVEFFTGSGQDFTITPTGNSGLEYIITLADGTTAIIDRTDVSGDDVRGWDFADGVDDGKIDLEILLGDSFSTDDDVRLVTGSGQGFTITPSGNNELEYIVTLDDGTTAIVAKDTLRGWDISDGTEDGVVDLEALINDSSSTDEDVVLYTGSGQGFTVTPSGNNALEYIISFDDGTTAIVAKDTLRGWDIGDGTEDGRVDLEALVNDSGSTDEDVVLYTGSGQGYTVTPSGNNALEYIVTFDDGTTAIVAKDTLRGWDIGDGTEDGRVDLEALVNDTSSTDDDLVLYTGSGQGFTITPTGNEALDYILTLDDGTTALLSRDSLRGWDIGDGAEDGRVDLEALINDTSSTDDDLILTTGSGQGFTIIPSGSAPGEYLIMLDDGRTVITDKDSIRALDLADGTENGALDVEALFDSNGQDGDVATNATAVCFTRGTMIKTDRGNRPIETLVPGDLVFTADHGFQPIRWIGKNRLSKSALAANPKLRPIRIRAGSLAEGLPEQDLITSPQHRILVRSKIAERIFGSYEVLIPAVKLLSMPGIEVEEGVEEIEYWHFMLDAHEIVIANGASSESLLAGSEALKALPAASLEELRLVLPEIFAADFVASAARRLPDRGMAAKLLTQRHLKNAKPIFEHHLPLQPSHQLELRS